MRGSDMASSVHAPPHAIPHLGQLMDDGSEGSTSINGEQTPDVLSQNPKGLHLAYDAEHFVPEETLVTNALALSCNAEGLTRETTGEKVDCRFRGTTVSRFGNSAVAVFSVKFAAIAVQLLGVGHRFFPELSNIVVDRHPRPMLRQYLLAELVALYERYSFESSPLCGKVDPADPREQREVGHLHPTISLMSNLGSLPSGIGSGMGPS